MSSFYDFQLESIGGGARELDRQIALLLSTREGSIPLDREFGLNLDFVDRPSAAVKSLYTAEVAKKIARFIPSVQVREVVWTQSEAGGLRPKVVIAGV